MTRSLLPASVLVCFAVSISLAFLFAAPCCAGFYEWVDANGVRHFTEEPPPGASPDAKAAVGGTKQGNAGVREVKQRGEDFEQGRPSSFLGKAKSGAFFFFSGQGSFVTPSVDVPAGTNVMVLSFSQPGPGGLAADVADDQNPDRKGRLVAVDAPKWAQVQAGFAQKPSACLETRWVGEEQGLAVRPPGEQGVLLEKSFAVKTGKYRVAVQGQGACSVMLLSQASWERIKRDARRILISDSGYGRRITQKNMFQGRDYLMTITYHGHKGLRISRLNPRTKQVVGVEIEGARDMSVQQPQFIPKGEFCFEIEAEGPWTFDVEDICR